MAHARVRPATRPDGRSDAFVFFGATGDLAFKQIFPALACLIRDEGLDLPIVGVVRSGDLEDLRERARQSLQAHGFADAAATAALTAHLSCVKGSDDDVDTFRALRRALGEARHPLHYLAVPPALFGEVVANLKASGCADGARIIVEKPFGHDLASSVALNETVHEAFAEPDILRIDDYLGKEPVQNLVYFRFANSFLAPLWNRDHVASVQITMSEAFDVAGRGAFHEQPGAIREGEPDRVFVDLDLVGLALDAVVEVRLGVAPVASGGGGLEDLASVGVAVPPDMADKAAAASAAGEQASERVLPAVDGPALPPAVPRPQLLDVLPGGGRAPWT